MDLEVHLARIERLIADARALPLSAAVIVNRQEVLDLLADVRVALPSEVQQARWIIKERDDLLDAAQRDAQQVRSDALDEQERILSDAEVVRAARREAERILEDAREQARTLRLQADDYVDGTLAGFEETLEDTLSAVARGREQLQTRSVTAQGGSGSGDGEAAGSGEYPGAASVLDAAERPARFYDQERVDP